MQAPPIRQPPQPASKESAPRESAPCDGLDLSMEVIAFLRDTMTQVDAACMEDMKQPETSMTAPPLAACNMSSPRIARAMAEARRARQRIQCVLASHAVDAVLKMIADLRSFYPDITREHLTETIHDVVYSDAIVGHIDEYLKDRLRVLVPRDRCEWYADDIETHIMAASGFCGNRAFQARRKATALAQKPMVQAVVLSASAGAITLGAVGGLVGLTVGTTVGVAVCAVPALCTFFLAIPVCAGAGGVVGACTGMITGAGTGLLSGGALGALGYKYMNNFRKVASVV